MTSASCVQEHLDTTREAVESLKAMSAFMLILMLACVVALTSQCALLDLVSYLSMKVNAYGKV